MRSPTTIHVEYSYHQTDEALISELIREFETVAGGERKPWFMKAGAIDLVSGLELIVGFVFGSASSVIVGKYLEA